MEEGNIQLVNVLEDYQRGQVLFSLIYVSGRRVCKQSLAGFLTGSNIVGTVSEVELCEVLSGSAAGARRLTGKAVLLHTCLRPQCSTRAGQWPTRHVAVHRLSPIA